MPLASSTRLAKRLQEYKVDLRVKTKLVKITDQGVEICCEANSLIPADNVVIAIGVTNVNNLLSELKSIAEVQVIGDAKEPRTAANAFFEANEVARTL